jgi:hypothetical protein
MSGLNGIFSVEVMLMLLRSLEEGWKALLNGLLKDDTLGALAYFFTVFHERVAWK